MQMTGNSGIWTIADQHFTQGGEGELHNVIGQQNYVAKIYKDGALNTTRQEKLIYMSSLYNEKKMEQLAWPIDVLKDQNGQVKGFIMRKFDSTEDMANLLDGSSNQSLNLNWKKRLFIALNLASLVNDIHTMGQVIGDMNPKNFGVNMNNGFVCAFDTDSFHLYNPNTRKWYPCTVLDPHYIAPELQAKLHQGGRVDSLRPQETFTQETDRFALAVLIFQLLFNGTHPFTAARVANKGSSVVVNDRVVNIYQRMSPYFNPAQNITLPYYAPPLSIVPDQMQRSFKKAFLENTRPTADEWISLLKSLLSQLHECPQKHYYRQSLSACPWCELNKKTVPQPTPPPAPKPVPKPAPNPTPQPTPKPTPQPPPLPVPQSRKNRPWYAHEILYLFALSLAILTPNTIPNKELLCIVAFLVVIIARLGRRENKNQLTGSGAKALRSINLIMGYSLLLFMGLLLVSVIIPTKLPKLYPIYKSFCASPQICILFYEIIGYALLSTHDATLPASAAPKKKRWWFKVCIALFVISIVAFSQQFYSVVNQSSDAKNDLKSIQLDQLQKSVAELFKSHSSPSKPPVKPTAKATAKPTAKPTTKPTAKPTTKPTASPNKHAPAESIRTFAFDSLFDVSKGIVRISWNDSLKQSPYTINYQYINESSSVEQTNYRLGSTYNTSMDCEYLIPGSKYRITVTDTNNMQVTTTFNYSAAKTFSNYDLKADSISYSVSPRSISSYAVKNEKWDSAEACTFSAATMEAGLRTDSYHYGLYIKIMFPTLDYSRHYQVLTAYFAPNGYVDSYAGNTFFDKDWTSLHWNLHTIHFFDKLYENFGKIPTGQYTVKLFFDGMFVSSQTFNVGK